MVDYMGAMDLLNLHLPLFQPTLLSKGVLAIMSSCKHGHGV